MKMIRVLALAGVVWVGVGAGWAQGGAAPKRAMTFADLMAMKRVSDPQVSPSGKWVMFSVTEVSLQKNTKVNHLWVVALNTGGGGGTNATTGILTVGQNDASGGGNDASGGSGGGTDTGVLRSAQNDKLKERQVTFGTGESFGRFSPDGKFVSYTGEGTKDDPVARITIATWDEATGTVGVGRTLKAVSGDADGAVWSPDSNRLMFVADVWPECSVKGGTSTNANAGVSPLRPSASGRDDDSMVGGTRDVTWWKGAEPATWAEEDACDKAKDEAADKSPVKGQVWDGLFYRHWDHYLGAKRSHVLVMDVDGKNARDLTPASVVGDAETPTFFVGGAQNYAWAPDSKEIAYVTNLDKVPAASTNNDVFTLRLDEPGAKAVKVSTSPGSDDEPEYSPDGRWLAFRSQARGGFESDRFRLMLFDREKKTAAEVELKLKSYSSPPMIVKEGSKAPPVSTVTVSERDLDNWVDEFAWATDSQRIFFIAPDRGQEIVYGTNVPSGNLHRYGKITGADTAGEWSSLIQIGPGYRFAGILMRADKPGEVAIANLDEMDDSGFINAQSASARKMYHLREGVPPATPNYLTHLNDAIVSSLDVRPLEPFWSTGAEGTKIEGFLLKPPGFDPAKKYPVKFLMHGGPQTAWGDAWSYRWNWELMAASGYVVIGINRRGSTGYGQKFVDEVSGDWGGRAYEDLMKGLDYAEAKFPFLDETRECALGASYGGFMANWVLTHTNRFKCIVTHDGMFDPVSAYGDTEEMWFNEWEFRRPEDFPKGWDGFAPDPKQTAAGHPAEPWRYASLPADEDPFRRWSPMRFIENAKTPTLIIHSQRDMRLDVGQGMEMFTALQRLGVPSKMLYFPDEGHWVLKPQNSQVWNEVVGDWCDRWTKSGKYAEK